MKFSDLSGGSLYADILESARRIKPRDVWAKILESPADSEIYYLLR